MTAEERALWTRVIATVKPMEQREVAKPLIGPSPSGEGLGWGVSVSPRPIAKRTGPTPNPSPKGEGLKKAKSPSPDTLDGGWDRRLSRGLVAPDSMIDLHGHSLTSAHAVLDHGLGAAISRGDRLLLLITGKPPRAESERPHARGAIRAAVGDWIAASRHADRIAAVRNAHPRHGGHGALYIVLRRQRASPARKS